MKDIVKVFKTLSDDTRLRMLNLLKQRECCVCEVMQALEISQTRASRNLRILYDAGFLKLRKEGLWALYSIDEAAMRGYLGDLVKAVGKSLSDNAIAKADTERLGQARRVGLACLKNNGVSNLSRERVR
jgi:ArsR family transcriptional regulator